MADPAYAAVTLKQLGFRARLASNDLRALAWTKWFLAPYFARSEEPAQWQIVFRRDDALFDELACAQQELPRRAVSGWVLHAPETRPSWECQLGDLRLLNDGEFGTVCVAWPEKRQVLIVTQFGNVRAPNAFMRAFRELASMEYQRQGAIILHTAALSRAGQAMLAMAPKHGGKTTFLIRELLNGAEFITNDRVTLVRRPDGLWAVGMPTIVSLRQGTLDLFPAVQSELDRRRVHFWRRPHRGPFVDQRSIAPTQLCSLTGALPIQEARISRILCLIEGTGQPRKLDESEAMALLEESVFDFTDTQRHFFASLHPVDKETFCRNSRALCRELYQQAECLEYPREGAPSGRER